MNVNEYGIEIIIGTGFTLTAATQLSIVFIKPDCSTFTVQSPLVAIGSTDLTTTAGTFPANTWAYYAFQLGDVDQIGEWKARLIYDDAAGQHLISSIGKFWVSP